MKFSQFKKEKTFAPALGTSRILDQNQTDEAFLQGIEIQFPDYPKEISMAKEVAVMVRMDEVTQKEGEKIVRERQEKSCDLSLREKNGKILAQHETIKTYLELEKNTVNETKEVLKDLTRSNKRKKTLWYMTWSKLSMFSFIIALLGWMVAAVFALTNMSKVLATWSQFYIGEPIYITLLASSIFILPSLVVKQRYSTLEDEQEKKAFMNRVFYTFIVSLAFFAIVFAWVNLPQQAAVVGSLFSGSATKSTWIKDFSNWIMILSQIFLEMSVGAYLIICAVREHDKHALQQEITETTLAPDYRQLMGDFVGNQKKVLLLQKANCQIESLLVTHELHKSKTVDEVVSVFRSHVRLLKATT